MNLARILRCAAALAATAAAAPASRAAAQDARGDRLARAVRVEPLVAHYEYLADDLLEGRAPGSRGGALAAKYVAAQFRRLGLPTTIQEVPLGGAEPPTQPPAHRTPNVIATLPGGGRADEAVVLGAHYDAYGIGAPVGGDSIYNGALDNAIGTAGLLAVAEAFVRSGVRPARTIVFVAFTAEETGFVGSTFYVRHPAVPLERTVAMLNIDGLNVFGPTRDAYALGLELSTLGGAFRRAAAAEGRRILRDSATITRLGGAMFFFRSDHIVFARAGVPSLLLWGGYDAVGRSAGWVASRELEYFRSRYHQPSDELGGEGSPAAAVPDLRIFARTALAVADAPARPRWKPGVSLRRPSADAPTTPTPELE